jgi:hypothetical protein
LIIARSWRKTSFDWLGTGAGLFIGLVLVLVVAGVAGLGFYQGWWRLSTGGTDGNAKFPVTVDKEKIEQDKEKAKEKVQELEQKAKEKATSP